MEAIGAASAILAIATAGVQCSVKLVTFAGQVKTAPEQINMIAEDVSLNASILQQLGALANENVQDEHIASDDKDDKDYKGNTTHNVSVTSKQSIFNKAGLETVMHLARKCEEIFKLLDKSLATASKQLHAKTGILGKVKLSRAEMFKWPFLLPGIDTMRNELKNVKGTLLLMLQVATLAYSRRMVGEYGQNFQRNTAIVAYSREDQELLVRSIVEAHKAQATSEASNVASVREPLEKEQPAFSQLSEPSNQHLAMNYRPKDTAVNGRNETDPDLENNAHDEPSSGSNSRRRSIATESISISGQPSPVQSQIFAPSLSASPTFSVSLMSPRASITNQQIHITYDTRLIKLPDSTIESQLEEWKSSISRSVLDQLAALNPNEFEALDAAYNLREETPVWIQFGNYGTLIQGFEDLKARTLTIITKGVFQPTCRDEKKEEKKEEKKDEKEEKVKEEARIMWIRVHRAHILPETLTAYALPWDWDEENSDYIVVKKWISEDFQDELFAHTRRLRESDIVADAPSTYRQKDRMFLVRKESRAGRVRISNTEGEVETILNRNAADGGNEEKKEEMHKMEEEYEQAEHETDDGEYDDSDYNDDEYGEQVEHETDDADFGAAEAIVDALLARYTV